MRSTWMPVLAVALAAFTAGYGILQPKGDIAGTAMCSAGSPSPNVVVYLMSPGAGAPEPPKEPRILDQKNLHFVPHVLPISVGTVVSFPNSDSIRHNVFSASPAQMFNLGTYPPSKTRRVRFQNPGVVEVLCNVHPEMSAYILVLETPSFTTTSSDGTFVISGLPSGDYSLFFWCEHRGLLRRSVSIRARSVRVEALLHPDLVKLDGQILVAP